MFELLLLVVGSRTSIVLEIVRYHVVFAEGMNMSVVCSLTFAMNPVVGGWMLALPISSPFVRFNKMGVVKGESVVVMLGIVALRHVEFVRSMMCD